MDLSGEDEGHVNALVNLNLPEFLVIPPRLWVGKTVLLHNGVVFALQRDWFKTYGQMQ